MSKELADHMWKGRHELLWRVQLSAHYHRRRERFLAAWDRFFKYVAVVGGSAAASTLLGAQWLPVVALAIAACSAASLVFGLADSARRHGELASQYKRFEAEVRSSGEHDFTDIELARWCAKLAEIESGEPASLPGLVALCSAELDHAHGVPDAPKITLLGRLRAQYI